MARNFSCGVNIELCFAGFMMTGGYVTDGQVVDFGEIKPFVSMNTCSGTPAGPGGSGYSYDWSSDNPGIASISGSATNQSVNLYGAAAGSTYVNGSAADGFCIQNITPEPVSVQVTTALRVVQTLANQAYPNCPSGQAGWERPVNRAVIDQNGQDIKVADQSVGESISWNSGQNNLNIGSVTTGTGITGSNGQYEDNFWFCSPLCPGSSATSTATQSNTDTLPNQGGEYNLTNSTIQMACSQIKINGALTP